MDRHRQVPSLGVAVDKEEEEAREVVPSLDPTLGARVNDLAKLDLCSFLVCRISILVSFQLKSQCTPHCVT